MLNSQQGITPDSTIRLAVQCDLVNKQGSTSAHGYGWQTTELSINELRKHITVSGFAISPAALSSGHRHSKNFAGSQVIMLDIDGHSLIDAQNDPFIQTVASFGYTTNSHLKKTDKNPNAEPRCRIGIVLDTPIANPNTYTQYVKLVISQVKNVTCDPACTDATRISYGNQNGEWAFYGKVLPVALLSAMIQADDKIQKTTITQSAPTATKILTAENMVQFKHGKIWLDENARRITSKLGVTGYDNEGYSNKISCPCPFHKNNDASPSAAWHRDKYHLHCFTSGKNYTVKATAAMLGIQLDNTNECRKGLFNETRKFFLGHVVKSNSGRKTTPLATFCRFLDAMRMYGNGSGWYALKGDDTTIGLDAALNGLFADNTLRYAIGNNLLTSDKWYQLRDSENDKGVFCAVVLMSLERDISYNHADTDVKNYLTVPPPPPHSGNGRPKKYYFVPTEQELSRAFGFDMGTYHDYLSLNDIQTNDTYTGALHRVLIEQRPGEYSQTWLGKRIGKSTRTIRRYTTNEPTLRTRQNERILGIVDSESKLPVRAIGYRFLQMVHTKTGELNKYPYCRSSYNYLKQFEQPIYAATRTANSYWSIKGKPLQSDITQELEQKAS